MKLYNSTSPKMPECLSADSQELKKQIHDFAMENSIIAVEVPTLECIDMKTFEGIENSNNSMYRL